MLLRLVRLADARERLTESEWPQLASCHDGDVAGEQAAEVHPSKVANVWQCRTCVGLSAVHRGAERQRHAPPQSCCPVAPAPPALAAARALL